MKMEVIFMVNKLKKIILNPKIVINKILWIKCKKRLKRVGSNASIGLNFIIKGEENIEIGDNFLGGKNVRLQIWKEYNNEDTGMIPQIIIGNNVTITDDCSISCLNKIEIDDGVLIGPNTFVGDNYHGNNSYEELKIIPSKRRLWSKGPIKVGKNVWIGRNVCIMPDVEIGDNSIIGANAVVTHNIPKNSVAVGIPARVIRSINNNKNDSTIQTKV